jgi:hypothetical protein
MDTKTHINGHPGLLQSASCLYPMNSTWMACWQCWNNITSLTPNCVKLSCLCLTLKGSKPLETWFKSVSCKTFLVSNNVYSVLLASAQQYWLQLKTARFRSHETGPRWVCWQGDVEDSTQGPSPETARASSWWPKVWKANVLKSSFVWLANVVINLPVSLALINCTMIIGCKRKRDYQRQRFFCDGWKERHLFFVCYRLDTQLNFLTALFLATITWPYQLKHLSNCRCKKETVMSSSLTRRACVLSTRCYCL